ncbi:unnamed protein product, partial [Staurois parvus]
QQYSEAKHRPRLKSGSRQQREQTTGTWRRVAVEAAAMGGHTAPYDKMEPTSSVRRPESGTWAECGDGRQQQWEAVQGPMTHSGPGSSMRRRYRGP